MNHDERLKFMRLWLKDLNNIYPKDNQKEIECLSCAIKQCQKNVDSKRDKQRKLW